MLALGLVLGLLAGCRHHSSNGEAAETPPAGVALAGTVHGGLQPVSGSQVTAYAAGSGGSASDATALACVQTDASGSFSFGAAASIACGGSSLPTSFSCPSTGCTSSAAQIYLVAAGGNPGLAADTNNSALVLLAAPGPYNTLSASTPVKLSELTTAASVYALAQMMGESNGNQLAAILGQARSIGAKSPWLEQAVARANSLASFSTSAPGTALPAPAACSGGSSDPVNCGAEEKLDSLADALAACASTTGPTSGACVQLFCVATPGAEFSGGTCIPPTGGAIPADTLQTALAIARNAGTVPAAGIYNLIGAAPPFTPTLGTAPGDWTLALNFSGGGLNQPFGIAIDAGGNIWAADAASGANSVSELSSSGTPLSPSAGYTGGGLNGPFAIAIDASGNVWVTDFFGGTNSVSELSGSGAPLSPSAGYTGGGLAGPDAIAIDASGDVWVANNGGVAKFSDNGTPLSPATGYTGGGSTLISIAIDAGGDAWLTVSGGISAVTELSSSGAPLSSSNGFAGGGLDQPFGIAIDADGNVWVANNSSPNCVTEMDNKGVALSPPAGFTGGGLNQPFGIAIDGGGNVWVGNSGGNSITELSGSGAPLSPAAGFTGGGLNVPYNVAIDAGGNVWAANYGNRSLTEVVGAATPKKTPFIGPPQSP